MDCCKFGNWLRNTWIPNVFIWIKWLQHVKMISTRKWSWNPFVETLSIELTIPQQCHLIWWRLLFSDIFFFSKLSQMFWRSFFGGIPLRQHRIKKFQEFLSFKWKNLKNRHLTSKFIKNWPCSAYYFKS